jgi:hypothetical protein
MENDDRQRLVGHPLPIGIGLIAQGQLCRCQSRLIPHLRVRVLALSKYLHFYKVDARVPVLTLQWLIARVIVEQYLRVKRVLPSAETARDPLRLTLINW